jgi:hypothetical protein
MDKSFNKFFNSIKTINETIKLLIEDEGIISTIPDSDIKTYKFTVVADGEEYENDKPDFGDSYMHLSEAKEIDPNAEVGGIVEVDAVEGSSGGLMEFFSGDGINREELEEMAVAGPKTYRVGGKVVRVTTKTVRGVNGAAKSALFLKKYFDRYGKKIGHSRCYCLKFVSDYIDTDTGDVDRDQYKSDIMDLIKPVQKEMLSKWDYCIDRYGDDIVKKDDRQETFEECVTIDSIWAEQKSIFDDIVSKLQSVMKVKGINIKKKKKDVKSDSSVVEKIVTNDEIVIKFSEPVERENPNTPPPPKEELFDADTFTFEILGSYKEQNNTVKLKKGGNKYIFSFDKSTIRQPQSGIVWVLNSDDSIQDKKGKWKGKIVNYR